MAQPSNPFASFGAWPWMGQTQPFAPIFKMPWQSDWMGDWARAMQSLQQGDAPNPLPPCRCCALRRKNCASCRTST